MSFAMRRFCLCPAKAGQVQSTGKANEALTIGRDVRLGGCQPLPPASRTWRSIFHPLGHSVVEPWRVRRCGSWFLEMILDYSSETMVTLLTDCQIRL